MSFAPIPSQIGDPTWEIATFFPVQGNWTVDEYFLLNRNRGVEFVDGRLEFLPVPTKTHELIAAHLYRLFYAFVSAANLGRVFYAGYRVRVDGAKYREPDITFISRDHEPHVCEQFTDVADIVLEIISPNSPARDLAVKRAEYAQAGIPEYWIVDPRDQTITVLMLPAGASEYAEAGKYAAGQQAESVLLAGLRVDVIAAFSQT